MAAPSEVGTRAPDVPAVAAGMATLAPGDSAGLGPAQPAGPRRYRAVAASPAARAGSFPGGGPTADAAGPNAST